MGRRKQAIILAMGVAALIRGHFALAGNTQNDLTASGNTASLTAAGSNWSLNHLPTVAEDAAYTGTVTGIRVLKADNLTVGSFDVTGSSGTFSIRNNTTLSTNSILTLGGSGDLGNGISGTASDLLYVASGATFNLLGDNPSGSGILKLVLGQSGSFNSVGTMGISCVISDGGSAFGITKTSAGTLTLSAANTYTGLTTVSAGTLLYGANNVISTGAITVNGSTAILNMGTSQTDSVGTVTLDGGGQINGTGTSTLTSTGTFEMKSGSVSAILAGGGIALNKTTSGTVTLSGANSYTGLTTIADGTLTYGASNVISTGDVTVNGATAALNLGSNHSDTVGTVTLDGGGQISGTGTSTLTSTGTFEMLNGAVTAILAGGVPLNKTTAGTVTLSGANTYTGATNISGGVLKISASNNLGDASQATNTLSMNGGTLESTSNSYALGANRAITLNGSGTIQSDAGTLTVDGGITNGSNVLTVTGAGNTTISSVIGTGSGGLTKSGGGVLTLSGSAANNYTGTTTVSNGTLHLGKTGVVAIAGDLTVNGGAVDYSTSTDEQIAASSNVSISSGSIAFGARTQTFGNPGSASGSFTQTGGAITIGSGTLNLNRTPSISAGTITFTAGGSINANDTLTFSGGTIDFQTSSTANVNLKNSSSVTYLASGTSTASISNSGGGSSSVSLGTGSATRTFLINDSNTLAAGTEEMNIAAIISGGSGVTLNKDGAGELKIASASTYQGPTTVSGGKLTIAAGGSLTNTSSIGISSGAELSVNGSTNSSATVTVNSGGKLSGAGTVGAVALSGTVSPGNSVGILTSGNQTWNGGGKYVVELNTAQITAAAGTGFDQLQMSGLSASTLNSGSKFIVSVASLTTGTGTPFDGTSNYSWIIAKTSASHIAYPGGSGTSFFDAGLFSLDTSGFTGSNYTSSSNNTSSSGTFVLSDSPDGLGDDLDLTYNAAAPEPTSLFLFGAMAIPILLPRCRRGLA